MVFKERLKNLRIAANLTQAELAKKAGMSERTVQNYELGSRMPRNMELVEKPAAALGTTAEELLGNSGLLIVSAHEQGGAKAARDIRDLVTEVTGMFAGGELSEEDMDGAMKALNEAYWIAKENNKKYTPKKYRKEKVEQE